MLIKINGEDVDIPEGSTIKDAIEISNAPYKKGSIVCLIKGESEIQSNILKYKIKTPKGSILIELEVSEKDWGDTTGETVDVIHREIARLQKLL